MSTPSTPFHDLRDFVSIPRLTGLVLAPDGGRLVASLQQVAPDGARYQTSLWEIDPAGVAEPRRLTHSEPGESEPAFAGDGSLLFTSKRPGPDGEKPEEPALWRLPRQGEAARIATSPGGLSQPVGAYASSGYVVTTSRLPGTDEEGDRQWRKDRKESKVSAILHDGFPVRYWDHELGPDFPRLLVGWVDDPGPLRDLTPDAGPALVEASYDLSPGGATVVSTWTVREPHGRTHTALVAIDVATGERRTLVDEPGIDHTRPVISPDGRFVAAHRRDAGDYHTPGTWAVCVHDLAGGEYRSFDLTEELTPTEYVWAPDSATLYVAGDRQGRGAIIAVDLATGTYRRIVSDAVYSHLSVSPDGDSIYALRSAIDCPPQPVRLDTHATDGTPAYLPSPAPRPELPGRLVEVTATVSDGATVRGWLVLPQDTSRPAPLMQWIHGGPFTSFNAWS